MNSNNTPVYKGIIFGRSTKELPDSSCEFGSKVLSAATSEAIRHLGDDFVQKIIDSNIIQTSS
jgi:hypothetical protein